MCTQRYNYITWMRNRDEISASTADEWRAKFLKEAKEMEELAERLDNSVDLADVGGNGVAFYCMEKAALGNKCEKECELCKGVRLAELK